MAEQHTPGPWNTAGITNPSTDHRMSLWGPTPVGAQSGEWIAKDLRPDNAEFIVRACNSHADLLAALKAMSMRFELALVHGELSPGTDNSHLAEMAFNAIAKAEGR